MEFLKRLTSAIFLAIIITLPLVFLEVLLISYIIRIYEIPYLIDLNFVHILGGCFIFMLMRNKIRIPEKTENKKDFFRDILNLSINRLFRIIFVWIVAVSIHFFIILF